MSEDIKVFLNERPMCVAPGSTVLDVVTAHSPQLAQHLVSGMGHVTDGVGRPLDIHSPVAAGAILRTVGSNAARDRG